MSNILYENGFPVYAIVNGKMVEVQEVRHGRWVKDKGLYKCTACNDLLTVAGWAECIPEKQIYTAFKYCPNCGALMDEVKE